MAIQIKLSDLKKDVQAGMKKAELSKKYTDGNAAQLTKLLQAAGLKIRKFKKAQYELVDDTKELHEESVIEIAETAEMPPYDLASEATSSPY